MAVASQVLQPWREKSINRLKGVDSELAIDSNSTNGTSIWYHEHYPLIAEYKRTRKEDKAIRRGNCEMNHCLKMAKGF